MYRMLKLKIFFGRFDWAIDHNFVNCDNENLDTLLKKEPCAGNLSFNLFSWVERKSLRQLQYFVPVPFARFSDFSSHKIRV